MRRRHLRSIELFAASAPALLLSACVSTGPAEPDAATANVAADLDAGRLVTQTCRVEDHETGSRVDGMALRLEIGAEGERWTALQPATPQGPATELLTQAVLTRHGNVSLEGKGRPRFGLAALRVLTASQLHYLTAAALVAPYNETARAINDGFVLAPAGDVPVEPHAEGRFQLGLGYARGPRGEVGGRFEFQAVIQPIDYEQAKRPFTMPAAPGSAAPLKPPFALQFVRDEEVGETLATTWYQEPFFPRTVVWSLQADGKTRERRLACEPPRVDAAPAAAPDDARPAAPTVPSVAPGAPGVAASELSAATTATDRALAQTDVFGDGDTVRQIAAQYQSAMDWTTALSFAAVAPAPEAPAPAVADGTGGALRAAVAGYCFTAILAAVDHMRELECRDRSVTRMLDDPGARKALIAAATRTFGEQLDRSQLARLSKDGPAAIVPLRAQLCEEPFAKVVSGFLPPDCSTLTH
jgi:hypothetical protein